MINMDEKKFAILLTDQQEVKILECDPQEEIFEIARAEIDCEWIELVEPQSPVPNGYMMLIDEEGKLRNGPVSVNCIASNLYGSDRHGDAIVGNALLIRAEDESLQLLTKDDAFTLAKQLASIRKISIDKISKAFGLTPLVKSDHQIAPTPQQRQRCKNKGMER